MTDHAEDFRKQADTFRKLAELCPGHDHHSYVNRMMALTMADVCEMLAKVVEEDEGL